MSSINKVILIGRVGKDPDLRILQSGKSVVNVTLATSSKYKDRNGDQAEDTQWHRLVAYDKLADIISQYVHKGSLIYVEGSLKYGKYTDKDGNEKSTTDIIINQMQMLGGKAEQREAPRQREESAAVPEEDIPFADPFRSRAYSLMV